MTVMAWLSIPAGVIAYLLVGWLLAVRDMPNAWLRAREEWPSASFAKESVLFQSVFMVACWPILAPIRRMQTLARTSDPEYIKAELKKRDKEIARLERELGIGRHE